MHKVAHGGTYYSKKAIKQTKKKLKTIQMFQGKGIFFLNYKTLSKLHCLVIKM